MWPMTVEASPNGHEDEHEAPATMRTRLSTLSAISTSLLESVATPRGSLIPAAPAAPESPE